MVKTQGEKPLACISNRGNIRAADAYQNPESAASGASLSDRIYCLFPELEKRRVFSCVLLVLGLGISIFPWLWRNYQITGEFVFDHPDSQTRNIAMRLSPSGSENPARQPGENDAEYTERLSGIIMNYYKTEPGRIISFVGSHYIHIQINNLLILPIRNGLNDFDELIFPETAFWQEDFTSLNLNQIILIFINLMLISLGLGAAWKKTGLIGFIPLFSYLVYNFSVAAARYSGGRYLIPVDWVIFFYYAIGLIEVTYLLFLIFDIKISPLINFGNESKNQTQKNESGLKKKILLGALIGLCFFLMGSTIPLSEKIVPERYPSLPLDELQAKFHQSLNSAPLSKEELQKIDELIADEAMFLGYGRAIYPRFYQANDGEPLSDKTGYRVLDYARFTFLLVSPTNSLVILKDEESPQVFPNASDVMVLGCPQGNYIDAALVILPEENAFYTAGIWQISPARRLNYRTNKNIT